MEVLMKPRKPSFRTVVFRPVTTKNNGQESSLQDETTKTLVYHSQCPSWNHENCRSGQQVSELKPQNSRSWQSVSKLNMETDSVWMWIKYAIV